MAILDVEGLSELELESQSSYASVTDTSAAGAVMRQFPLGLAFTRSAGWLPAVARGIARFLSRLWERRTTFVRNMDPRYADELLDDYERQYELEPADELQDRRDAVLAKVRARGGVTFDYYEQLAVDFGYPDAVVTDAADPLTTVSVADDFLQDAEWKVTFLLTATSQGAARNGQLQSIIFSQLHAGWYAIFDFT
jgi:uncharacterized protein YmfQ (DUF2313 family)